MNGKAKRKKKELDLIVLQSSPAFESCIFTAKLRCFQVRKGEKEGGNKASFFLENF